MADDDYDDYDNFDDYDDYEPPEYGGYDSPERCTDVASITVNELYNASCPRCHGGKTSLKALKAGTDEGCAKCYLVLLAILKTMKWEMWEMHYRDVKDPATTKKPKDEPDEFLCSLEVQGYVARMLIQRFYSDGPQEIEAVICMDDKVTGVETDVLGYSPPGQTRKPRRARYASQLRSWLAGCERNHRCYTGHGRLPTRVLDVGTSEADPVRLYISHGESLPFAALSHCWGKVELLRTVTGNLEAHQKEIPYGKLPANFQDAVAVTRSLKLRYLWIDALCIIQDSASDWEQESKVMCDIYSNAFIVIGADMAIQCSDGFLSDNEHLYHYDAGELWTIAEVQDEDFSLYALKNHSHLNSCRLLTHELIKGGEPLGTRVWCFQEQALARRMVHFSGRELVWQCKDSLLCECNGIEPESTRYVVPRNWATAPLQERFHTWSRFVDSICQRQVTYVSDRLPALSGLAQRMSEDKQAGDYLAGLWSKDLPMALCWRSTKALRRVDPYGGPTFSWVSVYLESERSKGFEPYDLRYKNFDMDKTTLHVTVLEASCTPKGLNPFGAFSSGHLKIKASLAQVDPVYIFTTLIGIVGRHSGSRAWTKPRPEDRSRNDHYIGNEDVVEVYFDCDDPWEFDRSYYTLPLAWAHNGESKGRFRWAEVICGLVVKRCAAPRLDSYERVGIFFSNYERAMNSAKRIFEHGREMVITLV